MQYFQELLQHWCRICMMDNFWFHEFWWHRANFFAASRKKGKIDVRKASTQKCSEATTVTEHLRWLWLLLSFSKLWVGKQGTSKVKSKICNYSCRSCICTIPPITLLPAQSSKSSSWKTENLEDFSFQKRPKRCKEDRLLFVQSTKKFARSQAEVIKCQQILWKAYCAFGSTTTVGARLQVGTYFNEITPWT